jgi:ADP-ribose pyrophosphatase YjhB (NUDIX family)
MKIRPSVAIVEDGKLLLMRYEYGGVNVYNLPGGNAEELEAIAETVQRELVEELNLKIEVKELILVGETHQLIKNNTVLHLVFEANIMEGSPIINPRETSALEVVWIPIHELAHINMYPNVGKILFPKRQNTYVGAINQNWF